MKKKPKNPFTNLSPEHLDRVLREIAKCNRIIERELAYLPHLQNQDRIAENRKHIDKLAEMVAA